MKRKSRSPLLRNGLFHGSFGFRKFWFLRNGRSGDDAHHLRTGRFANATVHWPRPSVLVRDARITVRVLPVGRCSLHSDYRRGVRFRRPFTVIRRRWRRRLLLLLLLQRSSVGLPLRRVHRRLFAGRLQQRRSGRGRGPLERVVVERPAGAARAELDAAHAARQEPGLDAARRVLPLPQERVDGRPFFRFPRFQRGLAQFDLSARTDRPTQSRLTRRATTPAAPVPIPPPPYVTMFKKQVTRSSVYKQRFSTFVCNRPKTFTRLKQTSKTQTFMRSFIKKKKALKGIVRVGFY